MRLSLSMRVVTLMLVAASASAQQAGRPIDPNLTRAREHYSAGWEYMRSEAFERAAAEFQLATDFNPKLSMAWYGLGRAHMALRKYQQALLNLKECYALFEAESGTKFNDQMAADRARRDHLLELQDIRNSYTKGPQTNHSRDMLRLVENQIATTSNNIDRGLNIEFGEPVPAFVTLSLGSAYFRTERFAEAEKAYRAALRVDDRLGAAHNNLAVIYLMQERLEEAQEHIAAAERVGFFVDPDLKAQVSRVRPESQ